MQVVRVYKNIYPECPVSVCSPAETQQHDYVMMKNNWDTLEHFDCSFEDIPQRRDINGNCLRCHWKFDDINKRVVVNKIKDCEHDILKKIQDKIKNPNKAIALEGLIEMERFKISKRVK